MSNNESSELRLGTEVKIIGPSRGGDSRHTGEKFEISQIDISKSHGEFYSHEDFSWYPASSLRKLTPEEMQPVKVIPTAEGNAKRLDAHREEMDAANERLSAIEQRQSAICSYNIETEQRLQKLEAVQKLLSQLEIRQDNHGKRLADVEYILSKIEKRLELIR